MAALGSPRVVTMATASELAQSAPCSPHHAAIRGDVLPRIPAAKAHCSRDGTEPDRHRLSFPCASGKSAARQTDDAVLRLRRPALQERAGFRRSAPGVS
ncbi:MAG: hypothetical protein MZV70_50280 [Desulfobacterales bacterium]|nr:hypothetical protein [Desulfobacterales bacterium]